jgi:hypothetical protein
MAGVREDLSSTLQSFRDSLAFSFQTLNLTLSSLNNSVRLVGTKLNINDPSLLTASFSYGGGTWYSSSYCSQSFSHQSSDIQMDVSSIISKWLNGTLPNNGFILFSSDELQATGSGFTLKFFSQDTNTIYSPYLDVAWDDSEFITGSIVTSSVTINNITSGISSSIQNGSTVIIYGGISGSFSKLV